MKNIVTLQQQLHYTFIDVSLLKLALTHRSYHGNNNERLEFLGDGFLDYAIALILYHKFPLLTEGKLSKIRATLVNKKSLVQIAANIKLSDYMFLGDGEKNVVATNDSILADGVEALIAAIVLDSNDQQAIKTVEYLFSNRLDNFNIDSIDSDSKSILQEYLQQQQLSPPVYNLIAANGKDHAKIFNIACEIKELNIIITANGSTKKIASQNAAKLVLEKLKIKIK